MNPLMILRGGRNSSSSSNSDDIDSKDSDEINSTFKNKCISKFGGMDIRSSKINRSNLNPLTVSTNDGIPNPN